MTSAQSFREASRKEVNALFEERHKQVCARTDRAIALIMAIQWVGAMLAAYLISPRTWEGSIGSIHPHLFAAVYVGGLVTIFPIYCALRWPGNRNTRHVIAACQMLMSALLIHISGGRIETHFHIFGSLAFLAFYLDWEVLVDATAVTLLHHSFFGYYMPASIFGTVNASNWRFFEHVLWVVFFDIFLAISCINGLKSLKAVAKREADHIFRALHDPLTGLANRSLLQTKFDQRSESTLTSPRRFMLMTMDLDRFKQVNDTLGHQVGDLVLIEVSKRMEALFGPDDMLARMGGDEFAAIVYGASSLEAVEDLASRVVHSLTQPILCGEHSIHIGVSIGICPDTNAAAGLSDLLHCADLALYKVKNTGRNRYLVFEEDMRARSLKDMSLEYRLRNAILHESFHLHYQPIVSADGVLLGFEALLRWEDGSRGEIPPDEFLSIAEETGLVVPIGEWVVREACAQAAEWHHFGNKTVKMSINVSAKQLSSETFVGHILHCLIDSGLPPELLCLELTDDVLIRNYNEIAGALRVLSNYGVHLSIDNFSVSHSAWIYPADLPIQTLKIDRAMTIGMSTSKESIEIVKQMINMAHNLQLRVVAKGVETREQMEMLRAMGCDEIQGFHISKAVSSEDAKELMSVCSSQ